MNLGLVYTSKRRENRVREATEDKRRVRLSADDGTYSEIFDPDLFFQTEIAKYCF
jgi:hypothetical protein